MAAAASPSGYLVRLPGDTEPREWQPIPALNAEALAWMFHQRYMHHAASLGIHSVTIGEGTGGYSLTATWDGSTSHSRAMIAAFTEFLERMGSPLILAPKGTE